MSAQDNTLEVWLDCDLGSPCLVGTLAHDRGQVRFHYERQWLRDTRTFALHNRAAECLDPLLDLLTQQFLQWPSADPGTIPGRAPLSRAGDPNPEVTAHVLVHRSEVPRTALRALVDGLDVCWRRNFRRLSIPTSTAR